MDEFQLQIIREKHMLISILMQEMNIPCWIIFTRESASHSDAVMSITVGTDMVLPAAFVFGFYKNQFRKVAIVGNFEANEQKNHKLWDEVIVYEQGITAPLRKLISLINPTKIALNYSIDDHSADGLSHGMYLMLEKILSQYKDRFISAEPLILAVRGQKTKLELEFIQKACDITEAINRKLTPLICIGQSETEIQELFYKEMDTYGVSESWLRSQCPMIDVGPEKEFGHIGPQSSNHTKKGHTLHNDFGVRYHGYCSDFQRMWFFGKKEEVPEELRHALETIVNAIRLAATQIKPGIPGYKIDAIAREYILSRGYSEYKHALGHPVGLADHDGGSLLGPLWERYGQIPYHPILINQVYTLEPSLKTKSYGMVSLEEMIVVTEEGCKFLVPPQDDYIYLE